MWKLVASFMSAGLFFVMISGGTHKLMSNASKVLSAAALQTARSSY